MADYYGFSDSSDLDEPEDSAVEPTLAPNIGVEESAAAGEEEARKGGAAAAAAAEDDWTGAAAEEESAAAEEESAAAAEEESAAAAEEEESAAAAEEESAAAAEEESAAAEEEESAAAKQRGTALLRAGKYDQAALAYREALALSGHDAAALHSNLSLALLRADRPEEAAAAAKACIAAKPEWHKAHYRLGDALFDIQDFTGAKAAYDQASTLSGKDAEVEAARNLAAEALEGGIFFKQLLPGRDIARNASDPLETKVFAAASQMQNYIYLVGDLSNRKCYVVDPCWDSNGIHNYARRYKMKIVRSIGTHYHFDHVGGLIPEFLKAMVCGPFASPAESMVPGIHEMAITYGARAHVHQLDADKVSTQCMLPRGDIVSLQQGQLLHLGPAGVLEVVHTPGHSPGSICILVHQSKSLAASAAKLTQVGELSLADTAPWALIAGDTIFPGSCGRLDLPDADSNAMFDSLQKLRNLDERVAVYPGHAYSGASSTIGREKQSGLLRSFTRQQWKVMF